MKMHKSIIDNFYEGHFAVTEPIPAETEDNNSYIIKTQIAMTENGGRCILLGTEDCNYIIQYAELETFLKSFIALYPGAIEEIMQKLVEVGMAEEYVPETYTR